MKFLLTSRFSATNRGWIICFSSRSVAVHLNKILEKSTPKMAAILEKWRTKTVLRLYLANRKSHVKKFKYKNFPPFISPQKSFCTFSPKTHYFRRHLGKRLT